VVKDPNQSTYTYGAVVELTANADPGWSFDHWSGDLTGTDNPDTIVMDGDKTVTATFKEHTIVSILPSAQIVSKGETFDVSVYVEPGEPITGITLGKLSFNATLIHANSVILEGFFDPYSTTFSNGTINNINGEIIDIYEATSPINNVSTDGYFCNISFTAQQEFGTSELDLDGVILSDEGGSPVPLIVNNGSVIIPEIISVISILPSTQIVNKGETFDVSVYVEPSEPIIGIKFNKLYFNQTLIQANSVTLEGFFDPIRRLLLILHKTSTH
jgi:hypothetical protein